MKSIVGKGADQMGCAEFPVGEGLAKKERGAGLSTLAVARRSASVTSFSCSDEAKTIFAASLTLWRKNFCFRQTNGKTTLSGIQSQ
jgi:hypothetical protein